MQAINYASNIDGYIKYIMKGRAVRIATVASPLAFGYDPTVKPYPYDPEERRSFLPRQVIPTALRSAMSTAIRDPGQRQFIKALQVDLAKVGIRVKIQEYTDEGPLATLVREGKGGPMYQISWGNDGFLTAIRYFMTN